VTRLPLPQSCRHVCFWHKADMAITVANGFRVPRRAPPALPLRASPVRFASGLRDIEMNYPWIACANRIRKFTISSTSFRCSAVCVRL